MIYTPNHLLLLLSLAHIHISWTVPDSIDEISPSSVRRAMSKARVYTDVNVIRPKEYWDYESLNVQWGYDSFFLKTLKISPFDSL